MFAAFIFSLHIKSFALIILLAWMSFQFMRWWGEYCNKTSRQKIRWLSARAPVFVDNV